MSVNQQIQGGCSVAVLSRDWRRRVPPSRRRGDSAGYGSVLGTEPYRRRIPGGIFATSSGRTSITRTWTTTHSLTSWRAGISPARSGQWSCTSALARLSRRASTEVGTEHGSHKVLALLGRLLIGLPFLMSGIGKLTTYANDRLYRQCRLTAAPLAGRLPWPSRPAGACCCFLVFVRGWSRSLWPCSFVLATAVFLHRNLADQNQMIHFLKNIMIIGGLLQIAHFGAGRYSLDARNPKGSAGAKGMVAGVPPHYSDPSLSIPRQRSRPADRRVTSIRTQPDTGSDRASTPTLYGHSATQRYALASVARHRSASPARARSRIGLQSGRPGASRLSTEPPIIAPRLLSSVPRPHD